MMSPEIPATLEWSGGIPGALHLIDQTRLPGELEILELTDVAAIHDAIRRLAVRGAPAIGLAAAYGVIVAVQHHDNDDRDGVATAFSAAVCS